MLLLTQDVCNHAWCWEAKEPQDDELTADDHLFDGPEEAKVEAIPEETALARGDLSRQEEEHAHESESATEEASQCGEAKGEDEEDHRGEQEEFQGGSEEDNDEERDEENEDDKALAPQGASPKVQAQRKESMHQKLPLDRTTMYSKHKRSCLHL